MSKTRKKIDSRQLSIFEALQSSRKQEEITPGQFKVIDQLRGSIRAAIKQCPLDRYQIAGEMSHLLGQTVTKEVVDSWTRESDEVNGRPGRHIPAEFLPAFCRATGNNEPLVILCQVASLFVLPGPEALRAEIHKLDEEIQDAKERKKERLMLLKEIQERWTKT